MATTFVEADHPRSGTGRFAAKEHAEPDVALLADGSATDHLGGHLGDSDGPEGLYRPGRTMPEVQSHSSLSDFSFCPTRWALQRIDGAAVPDDVDESVRWAGIVAHRSAELSAQGADPDAAFDDAMAEHPTGGDWYSSFRAAGGSPTDLDDPATCPADAPDDVVAARKAVVSFSNWERTDPDRDSLIVSEVRIDATVAGVALTGIIDAVEVDPDGAVVVVDYKTGKPPAKTAFDGDDDLARVTDGGPDAPVMYPAKTTRQLVLYAEMAADTGRRIDRVRLLYPASRGVVEVDLDGPYGDHLRAEARQFVATETDRLAEAHETGVFPARTSPRKCASCSQAQNCPAAA